MRFFETIALQKARILEADVGPDFSLPEFGANLHRKLNKLAARSEYRSNMNAFNRAVAPEEAVEAIFWAQVNRGDDVLRSLATPVTVFVDFLCGTQVEKRDGLGNLRLSPCQYGVAGVALDAVKGALIALIPAASYALGAILGLLWGLVTSPLAYSEDIHLGHHIAESIGSTIGNLHVFFTFVVGSAYALSTQGFSGAAALVKLSLSLVGEVAGGFVGMFVGGYQAMSWQPHPEPQHSDEECKHDEVTGAVVKPGPLQTPETLEPSPSDEEGDDTIELRFESDEKDPA